MKRIVALVLCLILLTVTGAQAIIDLGSPAVTRLWMGDRFACSATYIREARPGVAWILSAGHCSIAGYTKRNTLDTMVGAIDWRVVIQSHNYAERVLDIAIGTVPDVRSERTYYPFFAEKFPQDGRVFIHGFPAGVESVVAATVIGPAEKIPGSYEVRVPHAGDVLPGSSGSVVLDPQGYIVGVVWGLRIDPVTHMPTDRAIVTPVEAFHEVAKLVGLKL